MKTNTQLIADLARCIPWMHKRQARQVLDVLTALWLDELGQPEGSIQVGGLGKLYVEAQQIRLAGIVAPNGRVGIRHYVRFHPSKALRHALRTPKQRKAK